jgi:hypothetical protein
MSLLSMARAASPALDRVASQGRSGFFELDIRGWRPGDGPLNKVALCQLLQDGGLRLGEALDRTKQLLSGDTVAARLPFIGRGKAIEALARLGARAADVVNQGEAAE